MEISENEPRKIRWWPYLLAAVLIVAIAVGTFYFTRPKPCYVQAKDFIAAFDPLIHRWKDAYDVARSTSRINLGPAIAEMQSVKRDIEALDPPPCAKEAHEAYIMQADYMIKGFLSFMVQEDENIANTFFENAVNQLKYFNRIYPELTASK